jgi:outer membrane protein OmpA-like peptidoglycan-associated protein
VSHAAFAKTCCLCLLLGVAGCATVPAMAPRALIDARAALGSAREAKADLLMPEDFQAAQRLLARAEASFASEQNMTTVEDLAFEAQAAAQVAEAFARRRVSEQDYERAQQDIINQQAMLMALQEKNRKLQDAAAKIRQSQAGLSQAEAARDEEARRRQQAEQEAEMLRKAQQIKDAQVKLEARGLVINLSGRILFDSGSSKLQSGIENTLGQIAGLLQEYPGYHVRIEGHTDNTGELLMNNTLSQARAESVLDALTRKGVPLDNLSAVGLGPSRPIAANTTSAGRQMNRRVEIIFEKPGEKTANP